LIQLYSSLETNRKRKYFEIDGKFAGKAHGIVTNGRAWYFVEFVMDGDKPKISIHSEKPTILDLTEESEPLEKGVERILGQIVWLLQQDPILGRNV
jgi:predicted type IV restriction endonuclease